MNKQRKIIFLDIDGVLQPSRSENRFNYDLEQLRKDLAVKYSDEGYLSIDKFDVAAVYCDWQREAVANLDNLIKATKAEIVLSSSWRKYNSLENLQRLFKIRGLVLNELLPLGEQKDKEEDILNYLQKQDNIASYVVIDDCDMSKQFGEHFVWTWSKDYFDDTALEKAIKILLEYIK